MAKNKAKKEILGEHTDAFWERLERKASLKKRQLEREKLREQKKGNQDV